MGIYIYMYMYIMGFIIINYKSYEHFSGELPSHLFARVLQVTLCQKIGTTPNSKCFSKNVVDTPNS